MKKVFLVFMLIYKSFAAAQVITPGWQAITLGQPIEISNVPYQVSIEKSGSHNCGGNARYGMGANSCAYNSKIFSGYATY